jgi:hypothetical protein
MNLSDDDLTILISCVSSKILEFDETWGSAKWRREQKVYTDSSFYIAQAAARERAGDLLTRLKAEQAG